MVEAATLGTAAGDEVADHAAWPARAFLLAGLGAAFGLAVYLLTEGAGAWLWTEQPLAMAAAAFLAVGGVALAFSLERLRWPWAVGFALATGLVVALVGWWNGAPKDWGGDEGWQFFASLLAVAIALPLFQASRDRGRFARAPAAVLFHVWTNLILFAAACAFVLAAFLTMLLLGALFQLIGIDLLEELFNDGWPVAMLIGGAFGGAVGLLRDRDSVVGTLQTVVRAIMSVLAPVLATGLVLFVLALLFTGLEPLWEKTKSTTPIVLFCLLGALVLVNAVIGNRRDEEARSPVLRLSAMALVAVMLPLALVAAVSIGKRIGQYGLTPDRLWASVFVLAACVGAILYLVALLRGRASWAEPLRRTNVVLAIGICALALVLALPIVNFGALSARDQIARLERGKVTPDRFDWAAMRFDFGPAGRRALERLARSGPAALRTKAAAALNAESRWAIAATEVTPAKQRRRNPPRLLVTPAGARAPEPLAEAVATTGACTVETCRLEVLGPTRAVLLSAACATCPAEVTLFERRPDGLWTSPNRATQPTLRGISAAGGLPEGRIEVREVARRQVFVDGKPVGTPFD